MWTHDDLQAAARRRGERGLLEKRLSAALLAHERWQRRTEERHPPEQAKAELDRILDEPQPLNIPPELAQEFEGIRELRAYALARHRETILSRVPEVPKQAASAAAPKSQKPQELVLTNDGGRNR